jgi:hypothetical protein
MQLHIVVPDSRGPAEINVLGHGLLPLADDWLESVAVTTTVPEELILSGLAVLTGGLITS